MSKLLVTGASGHLGRRVVELLLEAGGADTVIAASRAPEKLADLAKRGAEVRAVDFDRPDSLAEAFRGVGRLLLVSTDALDVPGHRIAQHRAAIDAARAAGVSHVVYTSLVKPGPGSPVLLAPDHLATEQHLAASGLAHTILRNNVYSEMALGSLAHAVASGKLHAAAGDGKIGYVTREDCARVAVAALRSVTGTRVLDITGPELLTHGDLARIAGEISGKPVEYVQIPVAAKVQALEAAGLPQHLAEVYASFDAGVAQGFLAVSSQAVEELTGHPPTRFADFLAAHKKELLSS